MQIGHDGSCFTREKKWMMTLISAVWGQFLGVPKFHNVRNLQRLRKDNTEGQTGRGAVKHKVKAKTRWNCTFVSQFAFCFTSWLAQALGDDEGEEGLLHLVVPSTAGSVHGRVGALVRISAVQAVLGYGPGGCYRGLHVEVHVLTICEKRKHVTGITVGTVDSLTVAAAAVERDMAGLVANKVSLDNP